MWFTLPLDLLQKLVIEILGADCFVSQQVLQLFENGCSALLSKLFKETLLFEKERVFLLLDTPFS